MPLYCINGFLTTTHFQSGLLKRLLERVCTNPRNFLALVDHYSRASNRPIFTRGRRVLIEMIDFEIHLVLPLGTLDESNYQLLVTASTGTRAKKFD